MYALGSNDGVWWPLKEPKPLLEAAVKTPVIFSLNKSSQAVKKAAGICFGLIPAPCFALPCKASQKTKPSTWSPLAGQRDQSTMVCAIEVEVVSIGTNRVSSGSDLEKRSELSSTFCRVSLSFSRVLVRSAYLPWLNAKFPSSLLLPLTLSSLHGSVSSVEKGMAMLSHL